MRTHRDRIRHMVLFELGALVLSVPVAMFVTGKPGSDILVLTIGLMVLAMGWNYLYNWAFDHVERLWKGRRERTWQVRILHAMIFELGLLIVTVPLIAWWLDFPLWQALLMDIGFIVFFLIYAFVFNAWYDRRFPVPELQSP